MEQTEAEQAQRCRVKKMLSQSKYSRNRVKKIYSDFFKLFIFKKLKKEKNILRKLMKTYERVIKEG
jgi:hypothetical protein